MTSLRVIVMGIGGVGKSAITNRFVVGRWIEKYDPTVEESYQATIDVDGRALQVEILDTAGQDEYTALRETFLHTGDGFLLVYSITDDQTVEELRGIREQILRIPRNRQVTMHGILTAFYLRFMCISYEIDTDDSCRKQSGHGFHRSRRVL
jgi:Ras-related protein Rap-1B